MTDYITIEEAANQWGISVRRVQALCKEGRIQGAIRLGRDWRIPAQAARPADGRSKMTRIQGQTPVVADQPFPKNTPFLYMSDLYSQPGSADTVGQSLAGNPEAKGIFEAEVAYSRGQIDKVYEQVNDLLGQQSGFYSTLAAGMLLALCTIWRGELDMWRKAKQHIAQAPANTDTDRDIILLSLMAVDSMLYDVSSFPEWFKIGCFEPLHKDALPAAKVYYAKYLYAVAYAVATKQVSVEGVQGLALMGMLPNTMEPMISQAVADGFIMAEMYLRMTCAVVYRICGNEEQAVRHIDRAVRLALADGLYGFLAEYCRTLDVLLEQRVKLADPAAWDQVQALYKVYNAGWSKLSGSVRGKNLITTLSRREREVAKLAAFGMQNREIAEKLHMSLSSVKQAIRIVAEKTGASRDEFAAYL